MSKPRHRAARRRTRRSRAWFGGEMRSLTRFMCWVALGMIGFLSATFILSACSNQPATASTPFSSSQYQYQVEEHQVPTSGGSFTVRSYCDEHHNRIYIVTGVGTTAVKGCDGSVQD